MLAYVINHSKIIVIIVVVIVSAAFTIQLSSHVINGPDKPDKNSTLFKYFFVNTPSDWELVSTNSNRQYQLDKKVEGATFINEFGDRKSLSIDILVDNETQEFESTVSTPKKVILLNGEKINVYVTHDCGGGKGMGSYCEQFYVYNYDKRYLVSMFDHGSRIGENKSHEMFMDFLRHTAFIPQNLPE